MSDFDPRLDLSFEEFCEYVRPARLATGGRGGGSAEKHGKTLAAYGREFGSFAATGNARIGGPGVAFVPEYIRPDLSVGVRNRGKIPLRELFGRFRSLFGG